MTESSRESEVYDSDFYEEDEPIEKIMAIIESGFDQVTTPPDEVADNLVTMDPSPWLQEVSHTSPARHGFTWERHKSKPVRLRLSGAASS
jgi:hypothetical protein